MGDITDNHFPLKDFLASLNREDEAEVDQVQRHFEGKESISRLDILECPALSVEHKLRWALGSRDPEDRRLSVLATDCAARALATFVEFRQPGGHPPDLALPHNVEEDAPALPVDAEQEADIRAQACIQACRKCVDATRDEALGSRHLTDGELRALAIEAKSLGQKAGGSAIWVAGSTAKATGYWPPREGERPDCRVRAFHAFHDLVEGASDMAACMSAYRDARAAAQRVVDAADGLGEVGERVVLYAAASAEVFASSYLASAVIQGYKTDYEHDAEDLVLAEETLDDAGLSVGRFCSNCPSELSSIVREAFASARVAAEEAYLPSYRSAAVAERAWLVSRRIEYE